MEKPNREGEFRRASSGVTGDIIVTTIYRVPFRLAQVEWIAEIPSITFVWGGHIDAISCGPGGLMLSHFHSVVALLNNLRRC